MKSDLEIRDDVLDQLNWEPFVSASEIGVSVKKGIVTLSGLVDSYAKKIAAETAAGKVTGVKAIAQDIQIGVSPSNKITDTEIAGSVVSALKWHSMVPEEKIKVKVEEGVVTLDGEVEWDYQRSSAKSAVMNLLGVKNVISNIKLHPLIQPSDIRRKITSAFHRTATIDAERITVDVSGTKVTLQGKVSSNAEKQDAENAAWSAPGITSVRNNLELEPQTEFVF
jgi:osmotically-inducible protein OsmY